MNPVIKKYKREANLIAEGLVIYHAAAGRTVGERIASAQKLTEQQALKLNELLILMRSLMRDKPADEKRFAKLAIELAEDIGFDRRRSRRKIISAFFVWSAIFFLFDLSTPSISFEDYSGTWIGGITALLIFACFGSIATFFKQIARSKVGRKPHAESIKHQSVSGNESIDTQGPWTGERHCGEYDRYGWARSNPSESIGVGSPWDRF